MWRVSVSSAAERSQRVRGSAELLDRRSLRMRGLTHLEATDAMNCAYRDSLFVEGEATSMCSPLLVLTPAGCASRRHSGGCLAQATGKNHDHIQSTVKARTAEPSQLSGRRRGDRGRVAGSTRPRGRRPGGHSAPGGTTTIVGTSRGPQAAVAGPRLSHRRTGRGRICRGPGQCDVPGRWAETQRARLRPCGLHRPPTRRRL